MSDLLADLQRDRDRAPEPARVSPPRPALDLRVTPLHWARPRVGAGRSGVELVAGPVRLALLLHS